MVIRGFAVFMVVFAGLASCVTRNACNRKFPPIVDTVENTAYVKETVTKIDTVMLSPDTAYYEAYIECDSALNAKIVSSHQKDSDRLSTAVKLANNKLQVTSEYIPVPYLVPVTSVSENTQKERVIEKKVLVDKPLTKWQSFQIVLGRISAIVFIIIIGIKTVPLVKRII